MLIGDLFLLTYLLIYSLVVGQMFNENTCTTCLVNTTQSKIFLHRAYFNTFMPHAVFLLGDLEI